MLEGGIAPHEEGVGDASHARVPRALELGVEQRQFAVHRGALGELARPGAIHLERNSHGGDDVEDLVDQAGFLQTIADGAFDLLFVDPPLDLFIAGGIDGADVLHRHGAAGAVVVGDLAGKRDVPVDYQENIFAGLRMQTKAQHQQQHEAHCVNISSLEPGCGAGSSVHDHQAIAFSPIPLSESAPPGPLVIIHTKHPGAWEMKLFYATELKFDSTPGRAAGRHWRGNENESRGAPGKLWTSISSTRSWKSSG